MQILQNILELGEITPLLRHPFRHRFGSSDHTVLPVTNEWCVVVVRIDFSLPNAFTERRSVIYGDTKLDIAITTAITEIKVFDGRLGRQKLLYCYLVKVHLHGSINSQSLV